MKKTIRNFVLVVIALVAVITLTGCNHANTYNKFHNNGSNLSKSHILEEISIGDLEDLIENTKNKKVDDGEVIVYVEIDGQKKISEEYIYIFLGNPTNSTTTSQVTIYDEQAKQYNVSVIYWIDLDLSAKKLEKLNNILPMATSLKTNTTAMVSIQNGSIYFDSTSVKCNTYEQIPVSDGGTMLNVYQIAQNCFKNKTSVR